MKKQIEIKIEGTFGSTNQYELTYKFLMGMAQVLNRELSLAHSKNNITISIDGIDTKKTPMVPLI